MAMPLGDRSGRRPTVPSPTQRTASTTRSGVVSLRMKPHAPALEGVEDLVVAVGAAQDDDGRLGTARTHFSADLGAARDRHPQAEDEHIGLGPGASGDRGFAVCRLADDDEVRLGLEELSAGRSERARSRQL